MERLQEVTKEARLTVLDMIYKAQTSHIGSNFSSVEIMTVIFDRIDLNNDKFVLSAGWKAALLYYFLNKKGRVGKEAIEEYCMPDSKWIGLAEPICQDIVFAGGSMGMGFPAAVGLALSKQMKHEKGQVYCLMSDGELQAGTTWEAALFAAQHKLYNLTLLIDNNGLQAMGKVEDIMRLEPILDKFKALGWSGKDVDGHNLYDLESSITLAEHVRFPFVIVAKTVKGKGVSFMENNNLWHYAQIKEDDYNKAKQELMR